MLDFELWSSKQFGKTIFPNYLECIWLPLITFAWQLLCALFFPFAEIFAALCQAVDQQSCTEMHTQTQIICSGWILRSLALSRSFSLCVTQLKCILIWWHSLSFSYLFSVESHRIFIGCTSCHNRNTHNTHNDTRKIINLKCALFSRHYLCSHSLDCTHNLHLTDHRKQMNWNAHIHCVCGKSLVIFFFLPAWHFYILQICVVWLHGENDTTTAKWGGKKITKQKRTRCSYLYSFEWFFRSVCRSIFVTHSFHLLDVHELRKNHMFSIARSLMCRYICTYLILQSVEKLSFRFVKAKK